MAFYNMDLGSVKESKPVPAGRYNLTIAGAEEHTNKNSQKKSIKVSIGIDDHADAPNITHFMSLPASADEEKSRNFKLLMIKRFLNQFSIPYNVNEGFNLEDFAGATASCELGVDVDEDTNNSYNRLVLDRLPDEGE